MDWAQILVIILAIFLAIFLLLAIVLVMLLIKVTKQIKKVTGAAERTAENIEDAVANFSKVSSPMFLARMISKQFKKATKK